MNHRLRYALPIAGVPCYVNPLYLRPSPPPSLHTGPAVHIIIPTTGPDNSPGASMQRQPSRCNSNPSSSHVHPRGLRCGNGPVVPPPPMVALFARPSSCSHNIPTFTTNRNPALARWLSVDGSIGGMKQRLPLRHPMEWVGLGVHIVYHEPSTDPVHVLPTHGPSSARSLVYIPYHLRTGAPRVCPGTGHPMMSHDGFGGLLVQHPEISQFRSSTSSVVILSDLQAVAL